MFLKNIIYYTKITEENDLSNVEIKHQKMSFTSEQRAYLLGGISAAGGDRAPFATAMIKGNENNRNIIGEASFYYTPLGVLISVWIKGFEAKRLTYDIKIEQRCGRREKGCILPPLYERGGHAFFSSLTGKLTPGELCDGRISVSLYREHGNEEVACGYIPSAIFEKTQKIV